MRPFSIILLTIFIADILITSVFLKKTELWKNDNWQKKFFRIKSDIYHHDLMPNIEQFESWGGELKRKIITNSIGFRDSKQRIVNKTSEKKRILLIGDSFIEGSGYDYEYTFAGLLSNKLGDNYEILNSAVESYSPSIYFKKTQYYLSEGYEFDHALVFLDVSDIYDELFINFDNKKNIIAETPPKEQTLERKIKNKVYAFGEILRDYTITFRFLYLISDKTEQVKNYIKLKIKASKILKKSILKTSKDDVIYYRMTHIDRGSWTLNDKKYDEIKPGLKQADTYLKKLFDLLEENSIKSHLIIYPWPTQIEFGDEKHQNYWEKFSKLNNINLINLYNIFISKDSRKLIFENFIYGDVHWNKEGTKKIFNTLIKEIKF
jgi:hypothetical protein